jgi:hypothetical protein
MTKTESSLSTGIRAGPVPGKEHCTGAGPGWVLLCLTFLPSTYSRPHAKLFQAGHPQGRRSWMIAQSTRQIWIWFDITKTT